MNNPFTISFGKKPVQYISRVTQTNEILETFRSELPTNQIFMITGVRGSGKTVMMTTISGELANEKEWITVELNPNKDLLQQMAAKLYSLPLLNALFVKAKIDLSLFGIGLSIENAVPAADIEVAIARMLEVIAKQKKRLLVCIDEVTKNAYMKVFSSAFQILLRQDLPIFLVMTGLYENIYSLQNDNSLTFLFRAPKIVLEPLNFTAIKAQYQKVFNLDDEKATEMAVLTKGYPFAFQVLGHLMWKSEIKAIDAVISEYDQYLAEYVYNKIWSELSETDKKVVKAIAENGVGKAQIKEVRERLGMESEAFSVYRERLKRKGIVNTSEYGSISLDLPRFAEFSMTTDLF